MEQIKVKEDTIATNASGAMTASGAVKEDTIAAISTPNGIGGIAVIRISGPDAFSIVDAAWKGKPLSAAATHTAHLGRYYNTAGEMLDECVATVFRAPATFTGEDVVELSVHGSRWIQREVLADLIRRGARVAGPGEFTRRAYLNGRLDLAQAEGVADLISATSKAAHSLALSQTRGNFSKALESLRLQLIDFASLLELELDFSEEDVEFADREKMLALSQTILKEVKKLSNSYSSGSVLKEGIPVVIAGVPNAGKSSLLNLLLNDDKAIVSDIPGTTRDIIEDTLELDGYLYRFIDTAGLRESEDRVETIGIEKAREKMRSAKIVIWLFDPTSPLAPQQQEFDRLRKETPDAHLITLRNKSDLATPTATASADTASIATASTTTVATTSATTASTAIPWASTTSVVTASAETAFASTISSATTSVATASTAIASTERAANNNGRKDISGIDYIGEDKQRVNEVIRFSTLTGEGLEELKEALRNYSESDLNPDSDIIVTNARHYEALIKGGEAIERAIDGIRNNIPGDFIAQDVREALHYLGAITGAITTPTLLQSIFSRFCIGK